MDDDHPHFVNNDHALRAGFLAGMFMRSGIQVEIETDDEGNYTDEMLVTADMSPSLLPPTLVRIKVLPPGPVGGFR